MDNNNNTDANAQVANGSDPQAQAANNNSNTSNASQADGKGQLSEEVAKQIADLRAENAKHRNKAKEQEQLAKAAEEQRLKEQGEYKKLAEQHEARVRELEPVQERYNKLSETLHEQIKAQVKEWPEEVKSLVPGKDIPIEERLTSVAKLAPLAEKLAIQQRGQLPGNTPNPKPAQQNTGPDVSKAMEMLRLGGRYSG